MTTSFSEDLVCRRLTWMQPAGPTENQSAEADVEVVGLGTDNLISRRQRGILTL